MKESIKVTIRLDRNLLNWIDEYSVKESKRLKRKITRNSIVVECLNKMKEFHTEYPQ